jgi:hypothetical protein
MDTRFANIEGMFKTNTDIVKKALVEVPPNDWFRSPGDDSNHVMWVAGHIMVKAWGRKKVFAAMSIQPFSIVVVLKVQLSNSQKGGKQ